MSAKTCTEDFRETMARWTMVGADAAGDDAARACHCIHIRYAAGDTTIHSIKCQRPALLIIERNSACRLRLRTIKMRTQHFVKPATIFYNLIESNLNYQLSLVAQALRSVNFAIFQLPFTKLLLVSIELQRELPGNNHNNNVPATI